jgi:hypothetical protein
MKHQQAFFAPLSGASQYLLSVYRLHGIILTSIISFTDLSATLWLFVVVTKEVFFRPKSPIAPEVYVKIYLDMTSEISHPTSQQEE